jgi:hypothetical protein
MTPQDVEKYYKSGYNFHKLTGMSQMTYSYWKRWGRVPLESQVKLHRLTNGELKITIDNKELT